MFALKGGQKERVKIALGGAWPRTSLLEVGCEGRGRAGREVIAETSEGRLSGLGTRWQAQLECVSDSAPRTKRHVRIDKHWIAS